VPSPDAYRLRNAYIFYGPETRDQWEVYIIDGPEFEVEAGKTCNVELGKPVLSVRAINERYRNQSNIRERSVFSEGAGIYFYWNITGKAGEIYRRFSKRPDTSRGGKEIEPTIRIVDSKGKEVASTTIEYWRGNPGGYRWRKPDVKPGTYTVIMTQDTGPLAGTIEGKLQITIQ
jgi:hypothetical protein